MYQILAQGEAHHPDAPAWEGEGNLPARLWRTIWQVLLHPARTFTPPGELTGTRAFSFGLIMTTLGAAAFFSWYKLLKDSGHTVLFAAYLVLAIAPLVPMAIVSTSAGMAHIGLSIFRTGHKGFDATWRVVFYCEAALVLYLVPWLGGLAAPIWGLVVLVSGLAAAHETSRARVFWALVTPGLALVVLIPGLYLFVVGLKATLIALGMIDGPLYPL